MARRRKKSESETALYDATKSFIDNFEVLVSAAEDCELKEEFFEQYRGYIDAAFERRFLYKIKFEKPDLEAKSEIWRSLMPSLTKDDALILASEYDFSGGEISNIARKCFINELLFKQTTSLEQIKTTCSQEKLTKRVKIGF